MTVFNHHRHYGIPPRDDWDEPRPPNRWVLAAITVGAVVMIALSVMAWMM